jgi:hypothetical protein
MSRNMTEFKYDNIERGGSHAAGCMRLGKESEDHKAMLQSKR